MPLTVLLGGARSGKSALAARLAAGWDGPVTVVVTGEARDAEMAERIRRHRAGRPGLWRTVECPLELEAAMAEAPAEAFVLLDCLTLWVANLMEQDLTDQQVERRAAAAATAAAARPAPTVAVSNEVGSGIVPDNPLARRYRDLLGQVNTVWADAADRSLLLVAGRAVPLLDPLAALETAGQAAGPGAASQAAGPGATSQAAGPGAAGAGPGVGPGRHG